MTALRSVFVMILLLVVGCGGDSIGPEMADVSGSVTLDGKPLAGGEIFFVAEGFEGYGRIKDDGTYSLVRGAPVGECKVYVTKTPEGADPSGIDMSIPGMDAEQLKAMNMGRASAGGRQQKPLLPPEYSDPKSTKLSFTVPSGGTTTADFKL